LVSIWSLYFENPFFHSTWHMHTVKGGCSHS
jgi:hypothetical protein